MPYMLSTDTPKTSVYTGPFANGHRLRLNLVTPDPRHLADTPEHWQARGLPDPATTDPVVFNAAVQKDLDENTRWPHGVARLAAEWLRKRLTACEPKRMMIVGSLRRQKEDVGDIEILIEPRPEAVSVDLFSAAAASTSSASDGSGHGNAVPLQEVLDTLKAEGVLIDRAKNEGGKMKRYLVESRDLFAGWKLYPRLKFDLFICTPPAQWGCLQLIRTGPADFSQWVVTSYTKGGALPTGHVFKDGHLEYNGHTIPTPDEDSVFRAIGLAFVDPMYRRPGKGVLNE